MHQEFFHVNGKETQMRKYRRLLQPILVGGQVIKNRLVYPNASPHFLQGPETYPADSYRAFISNIARNGAAIVTVAEWNDPNQRKGPMDMDMTHMQSFDLSDPSVHNYLSQLADEVHFYQSKLLVTMQFSCPEGYTIMGGREHRPGGKMTKMLPKEKIPEAIQQNVERARFYKLLGYDGIDLRCDMDMVPQGDVRGDEYSGSLENRTRFMREILAEIRRQLGPKFIIHGTIAWEQPDGYGDNTRVGGGYFEKDAVEFIHMTEGIIDIMQVRENNGCTSHPTGYNFQEGNHPALDFCARMKASDVKMLMEPIGGFQDPEEMEKDLEEGKCDFFGVARGFLADYEYGKKLYEGRGEDIVPCILCNKCHGVKLPEPDPWLSVCSVNPVLDKCSKLGRMICSEKPAPQKVAVIGGGPAGMRAALYAAQQGHKVTLYEKTDKLGGQLFHGDYFSFKWPIHRYKDWLIRELEKSTVEIRMNTCPDPEEIESENYDAVLAATGAVPKLPHNIQGLYQADGSRNPEIRTCIDAIGHEKELGKKVIICGGSEVGMETAMYLCENGHDVTVLTRQRNLGHNCSGLHYVTMAWVKEMPDGRAREAPAWERYPNLKGIVKVTTESVDGGTVTYRDAEGISHRIVGDSVLICGGMEPQTQDAMRYAGISTRFFAIGDCAGAGNLQVCNEQAYSSVMNL